MNKSLAAIIVIVLVILVAAGAWFLLQPAANNTTNNTTNGTITPVNNNSANNTTNATNITAAKAKELAQQFTGMGVTLGSVTLTTFKNVKVWKVQVLTVGTNETVEYIYIDANSGKRVQ